jgi:cobalt/nickel transport system permease protein
VGSPEPRRSQRILLGWAVGVFAVSALTEPWHLAGAGAVAGLVLARGALRAARRTLRVALPLGGGLAVASIAWLRLIEGSWPDPWPYAALVLRTAIIAFCTFSVLPRVDLLRALAPFPTATRLLVLTLAQIHALRLLVTESGLGLRSRLPRRPGALDLVRGAGGITAALLALSIRNARDVSDAMRSRGF